VCDLGKLLDMVCREGKDVLLKPRYGLGRVFEIDGNVVVDAVRDVNGLAGYLQSVDRGELRMLGNLCKRCTVVEMVVMDFHRFLPW